LYSSLTKLEFFVYFDDLLTGVRLMVVLGRNGSSVL
jgi:hypothetical protein